MDQFARPIMWNVPALGGNHVLCPDPASGRAPSWRALSGGCASGSFGAAEPGDRNRAPAAARRALRPPRLEELDHEGAVPVAAGAGWLLLGHAPGDLLGHGRAVSRHGPGHRRPGLYQSAVRFPDPAAAASIVLFELPAGSVRHRVDRRRGDGRLPSLCAAARAAPTAHAAGSVSGTASRSSPACC